MNLKWIILFLAILVLSPQAFADGPQGPTIEPGPVVKLSDDAVQVSRVFLSGSPNIQECLKQWREHSDGALTSITSQALRPDLNRYIFSGIIVEGGDMVVGKVQMQVDATRVPAVFGFGFSTVYTCQVEAKRFR